MNLSFLTMLSGVLLQQQEERRVHLAARLLLDLTFLVLIISYGLQDPHVLFLPGFT